MKKAAVIAAALLVATICIPAAQAKKARPVATTFYLHGSNTFDELTLGELTMSPDKPTQPVPSSKHLINYVKGPREDCVNDWTFEPTFQGPMSGHIVGDVKVTLYAATSPGYVDVKLLPDFTDFLCGSKEHQPVAQTRVQLSPGNAPSVAVLKDVDIDVQGVLIFSVTPVPQPPYLGRLLYDSPDFASRLEFSCIPANGTSCT